ncbi:MAG: hypothetical protein U0T02_04835 [Solirubrobacteraceae bacterium]
MRKLTLLTVLLVALAVPSTALGSDACGYSNVAGIQSNGSSPTCSVTTGSGNLPFTGLDLGIVLGAGLLLLGAGLTLRRFSGARRDL